MQIQQVLCVAFVSFTCASSVSAQTVVVARGDTLSSIAQRQLGSADLWRDLCEANQAVVADCDLLPVGMTLQLPGAGSANEVAATDITPAADNSSSEVIKAIMKCDALDAAEAFTRELSLTIEGATLTLQKGTPGQGGYEKWNGQITTDGKVAITGEYIEGGPTLKTVQLTGSIENRIFGASGTRGPRTCDVNSM